MFNFKRKSHIEEFEEKAKGKSNEEVRQLELELFPPEKLQKPTCPDPCPDTVLTRYVKVYFPTPELLEEFQKRVTVRHIGERTTTDTQKIVDALIAMFPATNEQPVEEPETVEDAYEEEMVDDAGDVITAAVGN